MQQRAELSQFDDSAIRERREAEKAAFDAAAMARGSQQQYGGRAGGLPHPDAVPGTDNVVYAPDHPQADWGGFVSRDAFARSHFNNPAAHRENIRRSDGGFVPGAQATTHDHISGAGRRHVPAERDARFSSVDSATGPIICGPGAQDTDAARFKSAYQAQTDFDPTEKDQYGKTKFGGGRKHVVPLFEQAAMGHNVLRPQENQHAMNGYGSSQGGALAYPHPAPNPNGSLVGYRAPAFKATTPSMLSSIGSQVAANVAPPPLKQRESHISTAIPGYTGGRASMGGNGGTQFGREPIYNPR